MSEQNSIPVRKRISFRLLRNVAIAVLVLELLLATGQILLDYSIQNDDLTDNALQILNTAEQAAIHVVWTLDKEGGNDLVAGLLRHDAIVKAELLIPGGEIFSSVEKQTSLSSSLARWIFGGYRQYEKHLSESLGTDHPEPIGTLRLTFDSGVVGADFFKRTIAFLLTGLLMNIVLACLLLYIFHATMARSILFVGDALAKVDPQDPGGYRLPLPKRHRDDELGMLVSKTNDLLKAVGENIQRRLKAEEEVHKLNRELEARVVDRTRELKLANQELEAYAYTVSHDLRGPLRGIGGLCTALLEDYGDKLDAEGRTYLQMLLDSSGRMDELIAGLLELSRSTQGGVRSQSVDLSGLVLEAVAALRKLEPERQVEVEVAGGIHAYADVGLMKSVMENLVGNAWKYTGKTADAAIQFGSMEKDGETVYFLRDNGVGFDMSQEARLFVPFQRLHADDDFSGTGIGLATVKKIVARHGGQVWAESELGKGTTFYFTLRVG